MEFLKVQERTFVATSVRLPVYSWKIEILSLCTDYRDPVALCAFQNYKPGLEEVSMGMVTWA